MTSSLTETATPIATSVSVDDDAVHIRLADGRAVSAPLTWYPRLLHATLEERANCTIAGRGTGLHWPDLDEDISVESILAGRPSGESASSLDKWLKSRP